MSLWAEYKTLSERGPLRLVHHPNGPAIVDDRVDALMTPSALVEMVCESDGAYEAGQVAQWVAVETWKRTHK